MNIFNSFCGGIKVKPVQESQSIYLLSLKNHDCNHNTFANIARQIWYPYFETVKTCSFQLNACIFPKNPHLPDFNLYSQFLQQDKSKDFSKKPRHIYNDLQRQMGMSRILFTVLLVKFGVPFFWPTKYMYNGNYEKTVFFAFLGSVQQ